MTAAFLPCYFCVEDTGECTSCGETSLGLDTPCPTDGSAFPPDCSDTEAAMCFDGSATYPGCRVRTESIF